MSGLRASTQALHAAFDCALLDLDGVVYSGPRAIAHAVPAVGEARAHGMSTMFVTNNASRTPGAVADHLTELGIPTGPEEVTTAAMAAAALVSAEAGEHTRVLAIGGDGLRQALADEGLHLVESAAAGPTVVVQGFSPALTWADLAEAAYAVAAGAEHVASNLDGSLPTEHGFAPGNGALVAAVVSATGIQPRSTGKPHPEIFHEAAARAGAQHPLVIGDRLDTDLAGARAAGMPALHVCSGVDGPTQILRATSDQRPCFLAADLRGLAQVHPAPHQEDHWWVCGRAAARCDGDVVLLRRHGGNVALGRDTTTIELDEFRAAAAAAWHASDTAGVPTVLPAEFPQVRLVDGSTSGSAR